MYPGFIKKDFPTAQVIGIDVCSEALYVAAENALTHETDIELLLVDFLNKEEWEKLGIFDIIVSNPPYVPKKDKAAMHPNVLNFEPHKALFVPDNDALIFYEAIAAFGKYHLSPKGVIYVEIHESLGTEVAALFQKNEYLAEVKKDMQGKDRMIKVRF
ncbi:MAG: methyltransferase domain-containing protein [Bacteroidia bacterium]|nr:methyltransferase domain-containing protein [Bacteroidia bacterium]